MLISRMSTDNCAICAGHNVSWQRSQNKRAPSIRRPAPIQSDVRRLKPLLMRAEPRPGPVVTGTALSRLTGMTDAAVGTACRTGQRNRLDIPVEWKAYGGLNIAAIARETCNASRTTSTSRD